MLDSRKVFEMEQMLLKEVSPDFLNGALETELDLIIWQAFDRVQALRKWLEKEEGGEN